MNEKELLKNAAAALQYVEWYGHHTNPVCPCCGAEKDWRDGHEKHCALAKFLADYGEHSAKGKETVEAVEVAPGYRLKRVIDAGGPGRWIARGDRGDWMISNDSAGLVMICLGLRMLGLPTSIGMALAEAADPLPPGYCEPDVEQGGEWRNDTPPDGRHWLYWREAIGEKIWIAEIKGGRARSKSAWEDWATCRAYGMLWHSAPPGAKPEPPNDEDLRRVMERMVAEAQADDDEPCIACGDTGVCGGRAPRDGSEPCECDLGGCRAANGGWCAVCDLGHALQRVVGGLAPGALPEREGGAE